LEAVVSEADRATLARLREQTQQAEREGNASFFNDVAADDIVVMPPSLPAVLGRAATVEFMRGFLGALDLQITYTSEEIQVHGRIAFDRGTYTQTMTPRAGGESIPENGKYLWFYSQNPDGAWKFLRVIWNASQ
jgi:ketosteroid isomerase-like protein